jgi:hypothetical protein
MKTKVHKKRKTSTKREMPWGFKWKDEKKSDSIENVFSLNIISFSIKWKAITSTNSMNYLLHPAQKYN